MKEIHIGSIAALVLAGSLACEVRQQPPDCTVARGSFAAKYTLKEGPATGACREKKGELVGAYKYNPTVSTADGPKPNNDKATIALQAKTLGLLASDPDHSLYSLGDFPTTPDASGICTAATLSKAEQATAGGTIAYEWSNVRVLNLPEALGSQFGAELKYTEGGCTATYTVDALWPAVECSADADCSSGINPLFPVKCDVDIGYCVLRDPVPAIKR